VITPITGRQARRDGMMITTRLGEALWTGTGALDHLGLELGE